MTTLQQLIADRIEQLEAERALAGMPLFEDGPPDPEANRDPGYRCWGCGCSTPLRLNERGFPTGRRQMASRSPGWVVDEQLGSAARSGTWCPECAVMPGFGCVEEPNLPGQPVSVLRW